ncbi:MAG: hypothetical protein A2W91_14400 [Bacteroidetes bacterium GWF2_38_335]|nr:MAG: hypothetical protein A2W91_14400 [Bacteroidetes bacterium GWF2_38_335]OFY79349.1 MAG: hypothetical protein A2281_16755 [Bacteroidetes bacterium RIFOXYA12_FULL_38_20]HBS85609.1 alpha/beta hydrolase [Bacteroidales bacterium]
MDNFINHDGTKVFFSDNGNGKPVVFLHGYLESKEIWNDLITSLKNRFRIIAIDLPGHGKTGVFSDVHTMDFMAEIVKKVLNHLKIQSCYITGHSMGGYVALAFAEKYSEMISGLCLFHSHPFSDGADKKESRLKEVELIENGKKDLIYKVSIPNLYADENLEKLKDKLQFSMNTAFATPAEGVTAALKGMRARRDKSEVLYKLRNKSFLIIGKKDNLIPCEKLIDLAEKHNLEHALLENSGHMGFFEEPAETLRIMNNILKKYE